MKKAGLLAGLAAAMFVLLPGSAQANVIPTAAVDCEAATFTWRDFPDHDTVITVNVTQPGSFTFNGTVHTQGQSSGSANVSLNMTGNGLLTLTLTSPVSETKQVADFENCQPPTTTTTIPPTTTTTVPPAPKPKPPPPPAEKPVTVQPRTAG